MAIAQTLQKKLKKIKLLALDVDGVLTDGKIIVNADGLETKEFDVQDGFAIVLLRKAGFKTAIISARSTKAVMFRAKDLKIDKIYQDAYPKLTAYERLLKELHLKDDQVCFMGDDLPDICLLKRAGLAVAVNNAREEVKNFAHYVTKNHGGKGAVREVIEMILKTHGKWQSIVQRFAQGACAIAMLFLLTGSLYAEDPNQEQQFEGFNLQGYSETGEKTWDVHGDTADIMGPEVKINNVDANVYGEQKMNITADRGFVNQTNGKMRLEEDVVMVTDEGSQLLTDSLDWDRNQDLVTTPDKVFLTDPRMNVSGTGLNGHPNLKTAKVLEDVTVRFHTDAGELAKGEKPAADPSKIVTITSDGPMTVDQAKSMAIFEDNVVAVQTDRTLKADRLEVYFDQEASQIKEMICLGHVEIIQGENQSFADKAVYNARDQKLVLTGRPKIIMLTEDGPDLSSQGNPLAIIGN